MTDKLDSPKKVRDVLTEKTKLTEEQQDLLIQQLWAIDTYDYILLIPEYLDILITYVNEGGGEDFHRYDYYEYLAQSITSEFSELELKTLEAAALTMELLQVNSMTKDELVKIITSLIEKGQAKFSGSVDKIFSVLKVDGNGMGFGHHTIQEYFAARKILANSSPTDYFRELACLEVGGKTFLKPSWSNVIRFLLDSDCSEDFYFLIFELFEENSEIIDENLANAVTLTSKTTEHASKIFDMVFNSYQVKRNWIPLWARINLWKFVSSEQLSSLKNDIDDELESNTALFVVRGNIVTLIDEVMEHNPELIADEDKSYWKDRLVEFANFTDLKGVLQRESLSALGHFKDISIVNQVNEAFEQGDKLTKEAFVSMCSQIDPNADITIDYIAEGFKRDVAIKSRYAIYEIDSEEGFVILIKKFIDDNKFLDEFLDDESIFADKEDRDSIIIDRIKIYSKSDELQDLLKSLIIAAFSSDSGSWNATKSKFLKDIARIILSRDSVYPFELIDRLKQSQDDCYFSAYNFTGIFAQLINLTNLIRFVETFKQLGPDKSWIIGRIIYTAKVERDDIGEDIYQLALKNNIISPPKEEDGSEQEEHNLETYKTFKHYLQPEPGKYHPSVFEHYNNNESILQKYIKDEDIERLKDLVIYTGLTKLNTRNIQVNIVKGEDGERLNQYTITQYASFFGDVLRTAQKLNLTQELQDNRQNIIDFVPFAYSEDITTINEIIDKVNKADLKYIHDIYLDREGDARYFLPNSYLHFIEKYLKQGEVSSTIFTVLKSFVVDSSFEKYVRKDSLRKLSKYDPTIEETWLQGIFDTNVGAGDDLIEIAEVANSILIDKFQNKKAIEWLLGELKNRAKPFQQKMEFHRVTPFEDELHDMTLAGTLVKVADKSFLDKLLDIYKYVQDLKTKDKGYASYADYIWRIITAYIDNSSGNTEELINKVAIHLRENSYEDGNWRLARLEEMESQYRLKLGANSDIDNAINLVVSSSDD